MSDTQAVLWHQVREEDQSERLLSETIALLNEEWPRSEGARYETFTSEEIQKLTRAWNRRQAMERPGNAWPRYVLLLQGPTVVGHAKLSDCAPQEEGTLLIESRRSPPEVT